MANLIIVEITLWDQTSVALIARRS